MKKKDFIKYRGSAKMIIEDDYGEYILLTEILDIKEVNLNLLSIKHKIKNEIFKELISWKSIHKNKVIQPLIAR